MSAPTNQPETVWTYARLLEWMGGFLAGRDVDEARLAAEVLLAHTAECRRIDLYARSETVLDESRLSKLRDWVRRAAAHEPVAYIVEEKEFFSLPLRVTRDVLIPRPETEVLVECVLDHLSRSELKNPRLLDVGTGSGCLAIAVLTQCVEASVVATDVSRSALAIARENAERHAVLDRLTLVEADRLALPESVVPAGGFDVLMSNPPYVDADELDRLHVGVREYEPTIALTDGKDGLSFYRDIAARASGLLAPRGVVVVEVGDGKTSAVIELVERCGNLVHSHTQADRISGQPRTVMFSMPTA